VKVFAASLLGIGSEREFSKPRDNAEKSIHAQQERQRRDKYEFSPNDLTLISCEPPPSKSKGGRGASSSSPYRTCAKSNVRL